MRILDTQANANGQGVTESFIDEIIDHPDKYACVPLYADTDRLLAGNYKALGHMFDRKTGEFYTSQIGAITNFKKVQDEYGSSLIAEARIPKRETEICERIMDLYELGTLNFSFEIKYIRDATVEQDGVCYVDANDANALTGVCVVYTPAYRESVALNMVAETDSEETDANIEVKKMTLEEAMAALAQKDEELANKDQLIAERDNAISEKDNAIAELNQQINELNSAIAAKKEKSCGEEMDEEEKEVEDEEEDEGKAVAKAEDESESETATASWELQCKQEEIDRLRVEIASLTAARDELEKIKSEMAAREMEANQAMAKAFAEKQGLDSAEEAVAKAIAELDYRAIAELVMSKESPVDTNEKIATASFMGDGFEMKGRWDDLLAPRK